jgi:hypothetical protein
MSVVTYEGIVENGQIRLNTEVRLPEHAKVYVIVPDGRDLPVARVISPRLADPRDAAKFKMEIEDQKVSR